MVPDGHEGLFKGKAPHAITAAALSDLVPRKGLEPSRCYPLLPESSASTNSATWAMGGVLGGMMGACQWGAVDADRPSLRGIFAGLPKLSDQGNNFKMR
jgi:hypothetical protein